PRARPCDSPAARTRAARPHSRRPQPGARRAPLRPRCIRPHRAAPWGAGTKYSKIGLQRPPGKRWQLSRQEHPMPPVITSLLDTDLYKFTMWQALLHRHPQTQAEYRFVCRNRPQWPLARLAPAVNAELDALCRLRFTPDELDYLAGLRFIKSDFV